MKISFTTKELTLAAAFLAMNIVITRFLTFGPHTLSVNVGFIALVGAGFVLGPIRSALLCLVANIIYFTIFNSGQPYSITFWGPAILAGIAYGVLYYRQDVVTVVAVNVVIVIGLSFLLNTAVIAYTTHINYLSLLALRVPRTLIMLPLQIGVTYGLLFHPQMLRLRQQLTR